VKLTETFFKNESLSGNLARGSFDQPLTVIVQSGSRIVDINTLHQTQTAILEIESIIEMMLEVTTSWNMLPKTPF